MGLDLRQKGLSVVETEAFHLASWLLYFQRCVKQGEELEGKQE